MTVSFNCEKYKQEKLVSKQLATQEKNSALHNPSMQTWPVKLPHCSLSKKYRSCHMLQSWKRI